MTHHYIWQQSVGQIANLSYICQHIKANPKDFSSAWGLQIGLPTRQQVW
jgi:ribosomal protein S15P/S13E